jgi:hypothetical protein
MANSIEPRTIERLHFFTGQRLFATDWQTLEAFNRELRRLHNQSLHQAGIGLGFSVKGEAGDNVVTVQPGYAIDALGQEIVLMERGILTVPSVSDDGFGKPVNYDLAISYPDDSLLMEAAEEEMVQTPNTAVRLREEPVFHWIELDQNLQPKDDELKLDIKNGMKIILKRISVQNCRIKRVYKDLKPRIAQPEKLPRIFAARTEPEKTEWEFWSEKYYRPYNGGWVTFKVGLKTTVDTSVARFNSVPRYFARIAGERLFTLREYDSNKTLLEGFISIARAEGIALHRGFELRLLMPFYRKFPFMNDPEFFEYDQNKVNAILKTDLQWHVVWMGIED